MQRLCYAVLLAFGMLLAALAPAPAEDPPSRTTIVLAQEYWVFDNGQQVGPLAYQQVLDRLATGDSNLATQVWTSHLNAWVRIDTMPEFTSALSEVPIEYWVWDNEKQLGPLSEDEVLERIARGESGKSTQVWTMQLNAWVMLSSLPEFTAALDGGGAPPKVADGAAAWYLYEFDQQKGPFSKQDLIEQIARGDLGKSGYVWTDGMKDWAGIETIPEFAAAFAPEIEVAKPYYVIADGERVGPLTDSEIRIRILDGLSTAEDLAWKKGLDDWTPLSEFAELADALAAVEEEEPPPLPGEKDGPPPLPGDEDHNVAVIEPEVDRDYVEVFNSAMQVLEMHLPEATPTAPTSARERALDCIEGWAKDLKVADLQLFIDHGVALDESQLAALNASVPGITDGVSACVEEAEGMRDTLDALISSIVIVRAGDNEDAKQKGYACMREAVDPLSTDHRSEVADLSLTEPDLVLGDVASLYPGVTDALAACEAILTAAVGPAIDDGAPPAIEDKPEVVVTPKDDGKPPVIVAPKTGITDDTKVVEEKKEAVVSSPVVEPEGGTVDERLLKVITDIYEQQARDLPGAIRAGMITCSAGKYGTLTDAEKELMIANKMMISEGEMEAIEAAHPGLTASLSDCIPRF